MFLINIFLKYLTYLKFTVLQMLFLMFFTHCKAQFNLIFIERLIITYLIFLNEKYLFCVYLN